MKKFLVIAGLLLTGIGASAQQSLGEGNIQINGGLGLNNTTFSSNSKSIPLNIGLDYGINEDITVGANLFLTVPTITYSVTANGNYHFNRILDLPEEWDLYAGANLGYYLGFNLGTQIGTRYFFNEKWGVNFELNGGFLSVGYGAKLGVTYKL